MTTKYLTIRRWLGVAWLTYLLITILFFGLISFIVWQFIAPHDQANEANRSFPYALYPLAFIVTQALTAVMVSWFVGKAVLKPLAAMSQAARQIARGDLNFSLPSSQVREVAEVAKAFEEMGKALEQALGRQGELEQERRLFIGAIAHDLRTPLFSLRGYLEGLEKGLATTPEKMVHYLAVCREKADDLEKRISSLFAYARLEYMEFTPRHETLDFGALIEKVLESFKPQIDAKQIKVELANPPEAVYIQGDEQLLRRAFENLLDNALKYTREKGTVWLSWHKVENKICFKIEDNGAGIAAQDLPHLFEPLYQGENSLKRKSGGSGLGLAIVRRILAAHKGGLTATNRPEGGASFEGWLSLEVTS